MAVASNRQGRLLLMTVALLGAVLTTNGAAGAAAVDRSKPADDVQAARAELGPGGALIVRAMVGEKITDAEVQSRFGFLTFDNRGRGWTAKARDVDGGTYARCMLVAKSVAC